MNGGDVVIIGFRDNGAAMAPVARKGRLAVFPTVDAARDAAGALGIGVPMTLARAVELASTWGLQPPATDGRLRQLDLFGGQEGRGND